MVDPRKHFETEAVLTSEGEVSLKGGQDTWDALLDYFGPDAHLNLDIWLWEKKRSTASNRFYFGVIVRRIAEQQQMSVIDVHKALKLRLLEKPLVFTDHSTGEIIDEIVVGGETHTMTQKEFNWYVRSAELFGAEFFGLDFTSGGRDEFYGSLSTETRSKAGAAEAESGSTEETQPTGIDKRP